MYTHTHMHVHVGDRLGVFGRLGAAFTVYLHLELRVAMDQDGTSVHTADDSNTGHR